MRRRMLKSKIHRAVVTDANLHYVGSVTIDPDLLDAADILEHEQVAIVDVDNGARLETYAITGVRGSGDLCLNGAAARLVAPGDRIGLEALAVVDVDHRHLLVLEDVGRFQQVGIDRDRPDVVQVGVGDRGAVDLRLEHATTHGRATSWVGAAHTVTPTLSMSLARPKPTAARSRRFPESWSGTANESASTTDS